MAFIIPRSRRAGRSARMVSASIRQTKLVLSAAVFIIFATSIPVTQASSDSMTVETDQKIYALGQEMRITVKYTGTIHGDVKLEAQDARGTVLKKWEWSHASGDTFTQTVSLGLSSPGSYFMKAVHRPHHGEPSAQASTSVAVWSAKIINVGYPTEVNITQRMQVNVTVSYWFSESTTVAIELGNQAQGFVNRTLSLRGEGTGTYAVILTAPSLTQVWNLTARVRYFVPDRGWQHDVRDWYRDVRAIVVPEFPLPATIFALSMIAVLDATRLMSKRSLHVHLGRKASLWRNTPRGVNT